MVNMICPVKFTVNNDALKFSVTYMVFDITLYLNLMCIFMFNSRAMKDHVVSFFSSLSLVYLLNARRRLFFSSLFKILIAYSLCVPSINTLVLSANFFEKISSEALEKSFMYRIKRSGPMIDPWGTPCVISFISDLQLLYRTYCFLQDK